MLIHPWQNQFKKPEPAKYNLKKCKQVTRDKKKTKK